MLKCWQSSTIRIYQIVEHGKLAQQKVVRQTEDLGREHFEFVKAAIFNFVVENDTRKAVKTFCISMIKIFLLKKLLALLLFGNLQFNQIS